MSNNQNKEKDERRLSGGEMPNRVLRDEHPTRLSESQLREYERQQEANKNLPPIIEVLPVPSLWTRRVDVEEIPVPDVVTRRADSGKK